MDISINTGFRVCSRCKESLSLEHFNFHKSGERAGKPLAKCKPCASEYSMNWAKSNPDKARAASARSYRNNIHKRLTDAERAKRNEWSKIWARNNPGKTGAQASKRRAVKLRAKPSWANDNYIELFYFLAKEDERITGVKRNVDHIVPLISPYVCRLHTEDNLQILTFKENNSKGNLYWTGMFEITPELKQLTKDFNGAN